MDDSNVLLPDIPEYPAVNHGPVIFLLRYFTYRDDVEVQNEGLFFMGFRICYRDRADFYQGDTSTPWAVSCY